MALGDLYIDTTDLKDRLEIEDDDDMVRLTGAVEAATHGVNTFCGRQFNDAGAVSARVFKATDGCLAYVDDFSTTTGLIIKTDDDDDGTFERTWAASEYELEPLNGIVDGVPGWPYWRIRYVGTGRGFPQLRRAGLQVSARWGWTAVPANVTEASRIAAEEIFKLRDTPFGIGGYGDFGVIKVRDNPFTSRMLKKYQRTGALLVA